MLLSPFNHARSNPTRIESNILSIANLLQAITMKIGVNCFPLRPDIGGIKQYFLQIFNELLETDRENNYIFFYFPQNITVLEQLASTKWQQGHLLSDQREIRQYIQELDVFFCPLNGLLPRPVPCPTVVTLADIQEVFYPVFFTFRNLIGRTYHYVGSTKMADQVITHSHFSKDTIARHHGIAPEKIQVAYHCVDERFRWAATLAQKPATALPSKYIIYPANRWQHKNHDILLRAMLYLKDEHRYSVHAVFTGYDQKNGYQIAERAIEYGIQEQVIQMGYLPLEELLYLYLHADMLVFPSLFEGFGIPLAEAMTVGCPVVAAQATSLTEIGSDAAYFFNPGSKKELAEAIIAVSSNSQLRNRLIDNGRKRVKAFNNRQLVDAHLLAFEEARRSYRINRFLWNRCIYKYLHVFNTAWRVMRLEIHSHNRGPH